MHSSIDEQVAKYQLLDRWFQTRQGLRIANAFREELASFQENIGGKSILQLGTFGQNCWLDTSRLLHQWIVTPYEGSWQASLASSIRHLPVDKNSIDCIIAPFCMEVFPKDSNLLEELDRILKPMGHIIFFGMNPSGIWGLASRWGRLTYLSDVTEKLVSPFKLKRMMRHLSYKQCAHHNFYYIPPVASEAMIDKLEFFNEVGKMLWPFPAGFYCLMMQKYQACYTELRFQPSKAIRFDSKTSVPVSGRYMPDSSQYKP